MRYQDDTIVRLIEQMGGLLRKAQERMREGDYQESYELASEAVGHALGMDPGLVARLSPQALTSALEITAHDDRVVLLLAEALEMESRACESRGDLIEAKLHADQAVALRNLLDPARAN